MQTDNKRSNNGAVSDNKELPLTLSLRIAMREHLRYNHYPPLPEELIDTAIEAVEAYNSGKAIETELVLPDGLAYKGSRIINVLTAIESMHLECFLNYD